MAISALLRFATMNVPSGNMTVWVFPRDPDGITLHVTEVHELVFGSYTAPWFVQTAWPLTYSSALNNHLSVWGAPPIRKKIGLYGMSGMDDQVPFQ